MMKVIDIGNDYVFSETKCFHETHDAFKRD